jgi:hypothetical protein
MRPITTTTHPSATGKNCFFNQQRIPFYKKYRQRQINVINQDNKNKWSFSFHFHPIQAKREGK